MIGCRIVGSLLLVSLPQLANANYDGYSRHTALKEEFS